MDDRLYLGDFNNKKVFTDILRSHVFRWIMDTKSPLPYDGGGGLGFLAGVASGDNGVPLHLMPLRLLRPEHSIVLGKDRRLPVPRPAKGSHWQPSPTTRGWGSDAAMIFSETSRVISLNPCGLVSGCGGLVVCHRDSWAILQLALVSPTPDQVSQSCTLLCFSLGLPATPASLVRPRAFLISTARPMGHPALCTRTSQSGWSRCVARSSIIRDDSLRDSSALWGGRLTPVWEPSTPLSKPGLVSTFALEERARPDPVRHRRCRSRMPPLGLASSQIASLLNTIEFHIQQARGYLSINSR